MRQQFQAVHRAIVSHRDHYLPAIVLIMRTIGSTTATAPRLWFHRSGTGGPSVVFLPGAGLVGLDYLNVQQRVAESTTALLYDRAGTGWSAHAALPRTPAQVTDELRVLLGALDIPAPYVLVGHSLGAFYARRYAQRFGAEVAGLLLVDPGHEDILSYLPPEAAELSKRMALDADTMPDLTDAQIAAARGQYADLYSQWTDETREALIDHHLTHWRTQLRETANFETEVYDELRGGGPLPDAPLIVLSANGRNPYWARFMTEQQMREAHDGIRRMHEDLAAAVPRGEHRVVDGASHQYIHIEHPDAVVDAVKDLLARLEVLPRSAAAVVVVAARDRDARRQLAAGWQGGHAATAHLLQLDAGGHLLGHQRRLDAVEQALQPADQLGLRDAQLRLGRGLVAVERQRQALQLLAQLGRQALLELGDGAGVDLLEAVAALLVQGGHAHLLQQLLDHAADPHHLRRLLDELGGIAGLPGLGVHGHGPHGLAIRAHHQDGGLLVVLVVFLGRLVVLVVGDFFVSHGWSAFPNTSLVGGASRVTPRPS
jgi:pimeloyl-ACP methyl ester carboxylesterase